VNPSNPSWIKPQHLIGMQNDEGALEKLARMAIIITNSEMVYVMTEWVIVMIACFLGEEGYKPLKFYAISFGIYF